MNNSKKTEWVSENGDWKVTKNGLLVNSSLRQFKRKWTYELDLTDIVIHQKDMDQIIKNTLYSLIASSDKHESFKQWLALMDEIFPTLNVEFWQGKSSLFYVKDYLSRKTKPKRRPIKASLRFKILERDSYRCQTCGATAADGAKLHVDHILPVSKGGTNDESNLRALCFECNIGRGNRYDT